MTKSIISCGLILAGCVSAPRPISHVDTDLEILLGSEAYAVQELIELAQSGIDIVHPRALPVADSLHEVRTMIR